MTAAELLTNAYLAVAQAGERTNSGPDRTATQMLAIYADIVVSEALNDGVRVEQLLEKAQNNFGS
jgi:hypothetical protein